MALQNPKVLSRRGGKVRKNPLVKAYLRSLKLEPEEIGWGYRPSGLAAKNSKKGYLLFEDAFVRSLKPGQNEVSYGISVDTRGAIFDAKEGCDLIDIIEGKVEINSDTEVVLEKFREEGVSKYNWYADNNRVNFEKGVLVVDQSRGDASLSYGGVSSDDFQRMIEDAKRENPEQIVYLRTHPDQKYRNKKSCFKQKVFSDPRIEILPPDISPKTCFEFCTKVYVGTSLLGMEALIHGVEVITYGWNFYAGWGLTDDRAKGGNLMRPRKATLEQLFEAAYIDYCHYYDPDTNEATTLLNVINHIALQKKQWKEFEGVYQVLARDPWKEKLFSLYLKGPKHNSEIVREFSESTERRRIVWGSRIEGEGLIRMEDGFLRSKGLGAAFNMPFSLVHDDVGIYYDGTKPSKLENVLAKIELTQNQRAEAQKLHRFIKDQRLTKYNFATNEEVKLPKEAQGKTVIFIPGQVEDDASIITSSPRIKTNQELIIEVRRSNPNSFIIYKPHPDVTANLRRGNKVKNSEDCDMVLAGGNLISWITIADEIHTMTSTVGFEGVIHGKKVVTYGMPFYAGWGLTVDRSDFDGRRIRNLELEELIYGVLIIYPIYLNPNTGEYITALKAAQLLADPNYYTPRPNWRWRLYIFVKTKLEAVRRQFH